MDDVLERLTPEHFANNRIPSRSTLSDRLAGIGLRPDFVEAVADVCSRDAADRDRLLAQAAAARQNAARAPGGRAGGSAAPADIVVLQQRSLEVSDKLVRAMERAALLERERNDANQMVVVLLAMVDKLHRDIAALGRERDRLHTSPSVRTELAEVHERLTRSEHQRATAESELARARTEREKADRLAEEAADQVRVLTAELERLRGEVPAPGGAGPAVLPVPAPDPRNAVNHSADDMDLALLKAARHLDDRADRLDQLATELHLDNRPDNPAASDDGPDNSSDNPLDNSVGAQGTEDASGADDGHRPTVVFRRDDVLLSELVMMGNLARFQGRDLELPDILDRVRESRELSCLDALQAAALFQDEGMTVLSDRLIAHVVNSIPAVDIPAFVEDLRTLGRETQLDRVLDEVARSWGAADIVRAIDRLRAEEQYSDVHQLLNRVGIGSPPVQVLDVMRRVTQRHGERVLDVACRHRPTSELPALAATLRDVWPAAARAIERAHRERQGGHHPTGYGPHGTAARGNGDEDSAAPHAVRGDEPETGTLIEVGGHVDLTQSETADTLVVGLGWTAGYSDLEVDASAIALAGDFAYSDEYFVFYNQLQAPDASVTQLDDTRGYGEQARILVTTTRLPAEVTRVVFVLSRYDLPGGRPHRTLRGVGHPYIRVATPDGREIARHLLPASSLRGTAVMCGVLERHVDGWTFFAEGRAYGEGLLQVALEHGVTVVDAIAEDRRLRRAMPPSVPVEGRFGG
ncbi:TerD family protein [Streptomyces seoulensis]